MYTARPQASTLYWDADLATPCAIVVGAEHEGLAESWAGPDPIPLRIPMLGRSDSLNVNVSAAILLFEAVRQRA